MSNFSKEERQKILRAVDAVLEDLQYCDYNPDQEEWEALAKKLKSDWPDAEKSRHRQYAEGSKEADDVAYYADPNNPAECVE